MIDSVDEFARLFHASVQQYNSIIGTSDADLSDYGEAGGKLITYHGLVSRNSFSSLSFQSLASVFNNYHADFKLLNRLMV